VRSPRPSTSFLAFLALCLGLVGAALLHAHVRAGAARHGPLRASADLVRAAGLTDPCLFTEARYTRHPSQADRFAPFQDQPGAPEHFPSGSLVPAPPPPPPAEAP
jgi:hypothetical protein